MIGVLALSAALSGAAAVATRKQNRVHQRQRWSSKMGSMIHQCPLRIYDHGVQT